MTEQQYDRRCFVERTADGVIVGISTQQLFDRLPDGHTVTVMTMSEAIADMAARVGGA